MKRPLDIERIFPEIGQIQNETLRAQVKAVWEELWQASEWTDFETLPTSGEIPYPHKPHNRAVIAMALAVADAFERFHGVRIDRDVLIAAGLLQDASKLVETRPAEDGAVASSDIGRRYPHAFWATHVALRHGVPDAICHIILTHTPQSARFPDSLEGKILYYVDQLDVLAIYGDRWRKELMITK
ncbi:MAG: hypothetical protein M0002_16240 [Rhodospirillales bacterium]|nr:hypothetical protein [Rhodospirillales bacterium]